MIENMSIEQFYLLYKAGEVCNALLFFPAVPGVIAFLALFLIIVASSEPRDAKEEKLIKVFWRTTLFCFIVALPLIIYKELAPTFGEVKAFAVLKVSREAANSETAQRLIDEALRRLEAQEKGGKL